MLRAIPVAPRLGMPASSRLKSQFDIPMKTPVALPASPSGARPAYSRASQLVSSSSRWVGSMVAASRREIAKNP